MSRSLAPWILGLVAACSSLAAPAAAGEGEPVRRRVIALMGGSAPHPHNEDDVHGLLELPLNHLGMVVSRHYLENGPPPAACFQGARAVLTYFGADTEPEAWLWPWLENEVRPRGLRVVHFGELGPLARDLPRLRRWLAPFGIEWDDDYIEGPTRVATEFLDERACCYEADPRRRASHRGPRSIDARNRVWIKTRDRNAPEVARTPVVTGPWGAIALDPWTLRKGSDHMERRWHLDPFRFFREAVGAERLPAPHPSVLNGRRMLFIQIDGDGFESLSTVEPDRYAARIMLDEVLLRYRIPYTVSIIVRSLTPDYAIEKPTRAMRLARRILNLTHVEPASHGVLHTLLWQQDLRPDSPPRTIMWYAKLENYMYSQVNEVADSIRFINERLLDDGRKCEVMLWTGHANPREAPIRAARELGCVNLNGGVFRWDPWHDSVGFVTPWSRRVGEELQVYAGAANENDFAGFFDTMPGSFRHIDTTIERTGAPRILKPADIYIHFYSAETPARLRTLHTLIRRWAFEEPTAPVFGSTYCRAVQSAVEKARIVRTGRGWRFEDFGACRTVRIDDEPNEVDWERSRGLLGARRIRNSLYLHLARPDAEVVLAPDPAPHPHVEQANCILESAVLGPRGVSVTATAHNARLVVFAGFPPNAPVVVGDERRATDGNGRVTVRLEKPGTTRLRVRSTRDESRN